MADALLHPPPARLVAIGGVSGSGKSTVARGVAPDVGPVPGAIVLRSDVLRKRLHGVDPRERLAPEAYDAATSARVHDALAAWALTVLRGGHAVIVDATFLGAAQRAAIESVAARAGVPFSGVWLEASPDVLLARVTRRTMDASDADAGVVAAQVRQDAGPVSWQRLDASRPLSDVLADVRRAAGLA
jgi:predicted kinase